jgi:ammonium transporter Rh
MTCSVCVALVTTVLIKKKFSVIDIQTGGLCGAIGAGSCLGLIVNPAGCMLLGAISGAVCVIGNNYLSAYLEREWRIFDTFGIHNVRGLPGIMGGLASAIAISLSFTIP